MFKKEKIMKVVKENEETIKLVGFFTVTTFVYTLVAQAGVNLANKLTK